MRQIVVEGQSWGALAREGMLAATGEFLIVLDLMPVFA